MYTITIDQTIQQIIKIFYRTGIWQRDKESTFRKTGKKLLYTFFGALFPIFCATNALLCDDRDESIRSVQFTIQMTVFNVKLLYLLFKKPEILAFLNDQTIVHRTDNREEYEQANKKIKKFTKFIRSFILMVALNGSVAIFKELPIFSSKKALPLFFSLSWNNSEIVYWVAYLFLTLSIFWCIIANLISVLIWYVMLDYSIAYQVLGNKLRNLGVGKKIVEPKKNVRLAPRIKLAKKRVENKKKAVRLEPRSMFLEDLIVWIKTHRKLTETIERFRSCFYTLFFVQISTSGIAMCMSVYSLAFASMENIVEMEMYVVMLLYALFDIFLVMYLANEITAASDCLSYCLFESNWVEQTESCKKYVLIMGEVLKQPQQLVILIYQMNLETFTSIVNGGYSMFNILKSFQ